MRALRCAMGIFPALWTSLRCVWMCRSAGRPCSSSQAERYSIAEEANNTRRACASRFRRRREHGGDCTGGPAIGDIRSRCLRISSDSAMEALAEKRLLGHRLSQEELETKAECSYSSDDGSGRSELSDDETSFETSLHYDGPFDTRLRPRKDMSVAQWDAARGTAEVVVMKGKAWIVTGFTRGSQHFAFIEEIVFMVEQGSLVLLEGERIIPLLEAYSLVSSPSYGCSWDNYQVYIYLRKLGYTVGRQNVLWTLPKKRPPMLTAQLENLSGQLADVKVSRGAQHNDQACGTSTQVCSPRDESDIASSFEAVIEVSAISSSQIPGKVSTSGEMQASESCTSKLKLMYDIYLPNARFKKSNPGFPYFSLCVSSVCPPRRSQVRALEQSIEGRPVKFASVICDHVSIYSFDVVELPCLP